MRRYTPRDYEEMAGWYRAREMTVPPPDTLPLNGAIVPGIAAGFLYATDSTVAFMENFVTNPRAGLRERSKAITRIAEALAEEAHVLGFRSIVLTTGHTGIARKARALGYVDVGERRMMIRATAIEHVKPATIEENGEVRRERHR